jgi:hypothetical protein
VDQGPSLQRAVLSDRNGQVVVGCCVVFHLTDRSGLIFSSFRFLMCLVADSHCQSLCSIHLAVRLFFYSLRSIGSGCFMPFDSFMHSGFQIGFCKLLLRVINFSFSGISTSLLLRSSQIPLVPLIILASFTALQSVQLSKEPA